MAVKTEGRHGPEFLLSEAPGTLSRDTVIVTVAAGKTYQPGTVLEISTGKHVIMATSTSAAAVLYSELTNDGEAPADFDGVVINCFAEVSLADLVWPTGVATAPAAVTALLALGIKVRS